MGFREEDHRDNVPFHHRSRVQTVNMTYSTVGGNLDDLTEVVLVRFLQ
jgi:hypothetical protein